MPYLKTAAKRADSRARPDLAGDRTPGRLSPKDGNQARLRLVSILKGRTGGGKRRGRR